MKEEVNILIAESDEKHFPLIRDGLRHAGISNKILRFGDGQETLDFLSAEMGGQRRERKKEYLLLSEVNLPKVDGVEVLRRLKQDLELKKVPVILLTSVDDPDTVELCHSLGCSMYIVKPAGGKGFADLIRKVGLFLLSVEVPQINGVEETTGAEE